MRTPLDKNDRIVCAINPALINEVPWGKFDIIRPLKPIEIDPALCQ